MSEGRKKPVTVARAPPPTALTVELHASHSSNRRDWNEDSLLVVSHMLQ